MIAGLDEAGRGPLAGPVVAAAVVLDLERDAKDLKGLNDSKKLTAKKRDELYEIIMARALSVGVAFCDAWQIDALNILHASLDAMRQAFEIAQQKLLVPIQIALIDGNKTAPLPDHVEQRAIPGADAKFEQVMAASIVAKVERDRFMIAAAKRYPGYGFENHMGYGTPEHLAAIDRLGICELHRRSFEPVVQQRLL